MKDSPHRSDSTRSGAGEPDTSGLVALAKDGRYTEAEPVARTLVTRFPQLGFGWKVLGGVLNQMGRSAEALEPMTRAVALAPADAGCHSNLGFTLFCLGRLVDAEASHRRALSINPDFAQAHNNLGLVLKAQGRVEEALSCYRRALAIQPDFVNALNNLGVALHDLGKFDAAEKSFRRVLQMDGQRAEVYGNLGLTLRALGRLGAAHAACVRALQINPNYAQAHNYMGTILKELDRLGEAEASYVQALRLDPRLADAHNNLGIALTQQGRIDEALASYRRALASDPEQPGAISNLLFALNYDPDRSAEDIFSEYRTFDRLYGLPHRASWLAHGNQPLAGRRLKAGYVSPDFREHSCRHFLEPLLARHDKTVVEVFAYAELDGEDLVTARYKSYVDHRVPTKGMSDDSLAQRIRSDQIDVLVDLAGHTRGNRLMVFSRKPARCPSRGWDTGTPRVCLRLTTT